MNALPREYKNELNVVSGSDTMSALAFATNDRILRQRDDVLSWVNAAGSVQCFLTYGILSSFSDVKDTSTYLSPSNGQYISGSCSTVNVTYVNFDKNPVDAYTTDTELYSRDAFLYHELGSSYAALGCLPSGMMVPQSSFSVLTTTWDMASGVHNKYHEPNAGLMLTPSMFTLSDADLAAYDNETYGKIIAVHNVSVFPYRYARWLYSKGTRYVERSSGRYREFSGVSGADTISYDNLLDAFNSSVTLSSWSHGLSDLMDRAGRYCTPALTVNTVTTLNLHTSRASVNVTTTADGSTVAFLLRSTKTLIVDPSQNAESSAVLTSGTSRHWTNIKLFPGKSYTVRFSCVTSGDVSYPVVLSIGNTPVVTSADDGVISVVTPVITVDDPIPITLTYSGNGTVRLTGMTITTFTQDVSEDVIFSATVANTTRTLTATVKLEEPFSIKFQNVPSGILTLENSSSYFIDVISWQEQHLDVAHNNSLGVGDTWVEGQLGSFLDGLKQASVGTSAIDYDSWLTSVLGNETSLLLTPGPADIGRPAIVPECAYASAGAWLNSTGVTMSKPAISGLTPAMLISGVRLLPPVFWCS